MIKEELLREIGIVEEDISLILEKNAIYQKEIEVFSKDYLKTLGNDPYNKYVTADERNAAWERAKEYVKNVAEIGEENRYFMELLAWLNLLPEQEKRYEKLGIDREIFIATAKNITCKVEECKEVYGILGVFTDCFFLDFDFKLFQLGRFQYEVFGFEGESYKFKDVTIKEGDRVFFCHIPSTGKLTPDLVADSFGRAYDFFKNQLDGTVMPIFCQSWLLYEPYAEKVFEKDSNIYKFAKMFDIYYNLKREFVDCWRIFGKDYEGTTEDLPNDTTLQRKFIEYINNGGDFGNGYGIILYDGQKREIINRK